MAVPIVVRITCHLNLLLKHCRPTDLTLAFPIYGKEWKFCLKCKCRATGKAGIYQLSHRAKDHIDGYGQ